MILSKQVKKSNRILCSFFPIPGQWHRQLQWLTFGQQGCSQAPSACRWCWWTAAIGTRPGRPRRQMVLYVPVHPAPGRAAGTLYWGSGVDLWFGFHRNDVPPRSSRRHLESWRVRKKIITKVLVNFDKVLNIFKGTCSFVSKGGALLCLLWVTVNGSASHLFLTQCN